MLWNFENSFALSSGKYFMWACVGDEYDKEFVAVCARALIDDALSDLENNIPQGTAVDGLKSFAKSVITD